jgi:hypothetical protein
VDDVVAVEVRLEDQQRRYFMTWGRIQAVVDPGPLAELVLRHSQMFDLGGRPVSADVCLTLQAARDAPYFFEALIDFSRQAIPGNGEYEAWRAERAQAMAEGREISYLGRPLL